MLTVSFLSMSPVELIFQEVRCVRGPPDLGSGCANRTALHPVVSLRLTIFNSQSTNSKLEFGASNLVLELRSCGERGIRTPGTCFQVRRFSKPVVSATHPPHQTFCFSFLSYPSAGFIPIFNLTKLLNSNGQTPNFNVGLITIVSDFSADIPTCRNRQYTSPNFLFFFPFLPFGRIYGVVRRFSIPRTSKFGTPFPAAAACRGEGGHLTKRVNSNFQNSNSNVGIWRLCFGI